MLESKNQQYQADMAKALAEAMFSVGRKYGTPDTAVLLSGEIITACLLQISYAAATSEVCSSPVKTREFSFWCAKRIRAMINDVQEILAEGPHPWMQVIQAKDRH
jgi:hypothetical protein